MSKMVKEYSLEDKKKAMGLLMAGKMLKEISKEMGMAISTLKLWKKSLNEAKSKKETWPRTSDRGFSSSEHHNFKINQ